jgi:hypothetical protein
VSNSAESLAGFFTSTLLGASFSRQLQNNSPVLMLSSDCSLAADTAVGGIESDADGAYDGTLTLLNGLGLVRGIEIMPRIYENADSIDNRFSGLFWGLGKSRASYGLLLDGGTYAGVSSAGILSISGATPAIVVDARGVTSLDFPSFRASVRYNPRAGAALVGAALHVVRDAQSFDFASGEPLGVRSVLPAPSEDFFLSQSYPNPFNPATRLQFRIARHQPVRLSVYDLTGKEIATLLDRPVDPGTYSVTFDGSGLASGVYFCRLVSPLYAQTRKLILIR